ncbi:hypothetical protein M758_8G132000 [Ceratodon purpureus]|nr:hypothetical protein M758_8G132000 [Ceratodon purpureus]
MHIIAILDAVSEKTEPCKVRVRCSKLVVMTDGWRWKCTLRMRGTLPAWPTRALLEMDRHFLTAQRKCEKGRRFTFSLYLKVMTKSKRKREPGSIWGLKATLTCLLAGKKNSLFLAM